MRKSHFHENTNEYEPHNEDVIKVQDNEIWMERDDAPSPCPRSSSFVLNGTK